MSGEQKYSCIQNITPGMKNVNIVAIVLEIGAPRRTKDNSEVRTVRVADQTGSINMAVWNEPGEHIIPGDILRLKNGYANVYKGCLSVTCGKLGELTKTGDFFVAYSETPNMSELRMDLVEKRRTPPPPQDDSNADAGGNGGNGNAGGKGANMGPNRSANQSEAKGGNPTSFDSVKSTRNGQYQEKQGNLGQQKRRYAPYNRENTNTQKSGWKRMQAHAQVIP